MKTSTKLLVGAGVGAGAYAFYKAGGLYVLVLWGAALKDKLFPTARGPAVMDNNPVGPPTTAPTTVFMPTEPPLVTPSVLRPIPISMTRA